MATPILILLILLPPILFAVSNILDKKLTTGDQLDSNASTLMLVGAFFNLIICGIIFIIFLFLKQSLYISLPMFLNGFLFSAAIWIYLRVLTHNDTEDVVVWYQMIPIFGFITGAIVLKEFFGLNAILGMILIVGGSFVMSYRKGQSGGKLIVLMVISSALVALSDVVFAHFGREIDMWPAIYSDILGKAFSSSFFILVPGAVRGFVSAIKNKLGWQALSEITFSIGDLVFDIAKLYVPVAIVQSTASTQPAFVFVFVLILNAIFPKFLNDPRKKKNIKIKIFCLMLVVVGTFILFM